MLTEEQLLAGVVLPIDKPRQWSSFQAVNKVKATIRQMYGLKKFKIGHAGTLDPLASGLLLVCIGKATKQIDQLQQGDKTYSGTIVLGATTPCHDLERPINNYHPASHITREQVQQACQSLTGTLLQVPPIFSAVKIDGQRAYRYARQGEGADGADENIVQPKEVNVYSFEINAFRPGDPNFVAPAIADTSDMPQTNLYQHPQGTVPDGLPEIDFTIHCGKGTYIRSLARDLGMILQCGALLKKLRREAIGEYSVENACKIEEVETGIRSM